MEVKKFSGDIRIEENSKRYILGGVQEDERGIFGNGYYARLYFMPRLGMGLTVHHCEIYEVKTKGNLTIERLVAFAPRWYGCNAECLRQSRGEDGKVKRFVTDTRVKARKKNWYTTERRRERYEKERAKRNGVVMVDDNTDVREALTKEGLRKLALIEEQSKQDI